MFADVSFPISSYQIFSYKIPKSLSGKVAVGMRVKAMFGRRKAQGIVVKIKKISEFKGHIRPIESLVDDQPVLDPTLWKLINWLAEYYYTRLPFHPIYPLGINLKSK
jgi:primosomal protein N' (replication factor Y)